MDWKQEEMFLMSTFVKIIENELNTSLSCVGYRQMTENLYLKYGVNVAKEKTLVRLWNLLIQMELTNKKVKLLCVENIYLDI